MLQWCLFQLRSVLPTCQKLVGHPLSTPSDIEGKRVKQGNLCYIYVCDCVAPYHHKCTVGDVDKRLCFTWNPYSLNHAKRPAQFKQLFSGISKEKLFRIKRGRLCLVLDVKQLRLPSHETLWCGCCFFIWLFWSDVLRACVYSGHEWGQGRELTLHVIKITSSSLNHQPLQWKQDTGGSRLIGNWDRSVIMRSLRMKANLDWGVFGLSGTNLHGHLC